LNLAALRQALFGPSYSSVLRSLRSVGLLLCNEPQDYQRDRPNQRQRYGGEERSEQRRVPQPGAAGLAALLTPESGPEVRRRIADRLRRAEEKVPDLDRVVREPQPEPEPAA
jgi:hypothetical protein